MRLLVNKSVLAILLALLLVATFLAGCATAPPIDDGDMVPAPLGEARPELCGTPLLRNELLSAVIGPDDGSKENTAGQTVLNIRLNSDDANRWSGSNALIETVAVNSCTTVAERSYPLQQDAEVVHTNIALERLPAHQSEREVFYRVRIDDYSVATPAFYPDLEEFWLECTGDLIFETFEPSKKLGGKQTYNLSTDEPSNLCIELSANSFWVVRQLFVNGQRLLPFSEDWKDGPKYRIEYPATRRNHKITVDMSKGGYDLRVFARSRNPNRDAQAAIDCGGRLIGFQNPFFGTYAPVIRREGVAITCTAYFRTNRNHQTNFILGNNPLFLRGIVQVPVSATGYTDDQGVFSMTISEEAMRRAGVSPSDLLVSIQTDCAHDSQCGIDRRGASTSNPSAAVNLNVSSVVDLAFSGLVARLVTAADAPDVTGQARNDYPVIVHEAFDPLLEDGTEAMFWALGGQPVDYRRPGSNSIVANACDGVIRGRCYNVNNQLFPQPVDPDCVWFNGCDGTGSGSTDKFRCEGTNALLPILLAGYDVWLVDQVLPNASLLDVARSGPGMYQMIFDYQNLGTPDPDDERRMAVIGLSAGGIAARAALRMWEVLVDTAATNALNPKPRMPKEFTIGPDAIAMYLSYDSPHLGAMVAPSFQAVVKDNTSPSRRNFANLVDSQMAAELLQSFIDVHVDTECIKSGEPHSCDINAEDFKDWEDPIRRTVFELFATELLGMPNPDHGFGRDGLPRGMKRIAVSNGSLTEDPLHESDVVVKMKVDSIFGDWGDRNLRLRDSNLVRGSGLPTYCRVKELEDDGAWYYDFDTTVVMKPDGVDPRKTYPTFIPTESALILKGDARDPVSALPELSVRWTDAMWEMHNSSHFQLTDDQCKFIVYHLEDSLVGDNDGYAACDIRPERSCLGGGSKPGNLITMQEGPNQCDCDDSRADINPGMDEIFGDFIDNDCDGGIDNELPFPTENPNVESKTLNLP